MRCLCLIVLLSAACGAGVNDTSAPEVETPQTLGTNAFDDAADAQAEAASRTTRAARLALGYLPRFLWNHSLPIDSMAPGIGAFGGTELRAIVAFEGKLFASVGYWMDKARTNPKLPGAQILRLDSASADWVVDTEAQPNGARRP